MEILNTSEIKRQAGRAIKENPGIIGAFLLVTFLGSLVSGLAGIIPVAGSFLSLFITNVVIGMSMMKLESKAFEENEVKINKYSGFIKILLIEVLLVVVLTIAIICVVIGAFAGASNEFEVMFSLLGKMMAMYFIIIICMLAFYTLYLYPRAYVAAKFNEYDNDVQKDIMDSFKENGLFKRILTLEFSLFLEMFCISLLLWIVIIVASLVSEMLVIPFAILFIGTMFYYVVKQMLARVILFRELSNQVEFE